MFLPALVLVVAVSGAPPAVVNRFEKPIRGSYIVRVKDSANPKELSTEFLKRFGGAVVSVNMAPVPTLVFSGWNDATAITVASDPRVEFVDENAYLKTTDTQQLRALGQTNPSLDRLDQRDNTLDLRFRYPFDGESKLIYVVDTGVTSNPAFGGRVLGGRSFVDGLATDDTNGHGTAMASVAAGFVLGTAKRATIVPVKISNSALIQLNVLEDGLRWVLTQEPGVVNLSNAAVTSGTTTTLEQLVNQLHAAGFVVVASAGNGNQDTSSIVPARVPVALTVGAIAVNTHARWFDSSNSASNFGTAIDLFAPGADVRVETPSSMTVLGSGTSPAAGFTSGVVANLLQTGTLTPAAATSLTVSAATPNVLSNLNGSANQLLFSDIRASTVASGGVIPAWSYCTWGVAPQWRQRTIQITAATTDSQGNLFLAYSSAEPAFCTSATFITPSTTFVEKRSPAGVVLWTQSVARGSSITEAVQRLAVGHFGDLYLVGMTSDCGGTACQATAGLVRRLATSTGTAVWTRRFETPQLDIVSGLQFVGTAQQAHPPLVVVGTTGGVIAGMNAGGNDVFVAQLDATDGAVATTPSPFQFGSSGNDAAFDLTTFNGSLVVVGSTTGTLGSTSFGGADAFLATIIMGGNGSYFFRGLTTQLGTSGDDSATAAVGTTELTSFGTIAALFVVGRTTGAFSGFTNQGSDDVFHVRFDDGVSNQRWLFQHGTSSAEAAPQLALSPDDLFIAAGTSVRKVSRISGLTAWTTTESVSRNVITAEPTRHVYTLGTTTFDRRRAF